jgi:hypothetical protein
VTTRPGAAQHLRDLARLRRVRDRIDREYAQPLDVEALARGAHLYPHLPRSRGQPDPHPGAALIRLAIAPEVKRLGLLRRTEVLRNG